VLLWQSQALACAWTWPGVGVAGGHYRESSVEVVREGHDVLVFVDLWQR